MQPRRRELAPGQCESSFRDAGNAIAALCSRGHQHHAISDTARGDFSLCSSSSGNRVHVFRMGIRIRASENCCTPAADRLDSLSSIAARTKRDLVQSGQMIQWPDLLIDLIEEITGGKRPKARSLVSLQRDLSSQVSQQSAGTDSASALHFEPIFVDFESLDLRIERSRGQP
jgi:hypothetical protein